MCKNVFNDLIKRSERRKWRTVSIYLAHFKWKVKTSLLISEISFIYFVMQCALYKLQHLLANIVDHTGIQRIQYVLFIILQK